METINKYFPDLTELQTERLSALKPLYTDWNDKINLVSRKDIDHLYLKHILHSLSIAKVCTFDKGARVMDVGSGGGFPGIPLAILFPETQFTLVDSIGKKVNVINDIKDKLALSNVRTFNTRVENINEKFDYVVSRAVTEMSKFVGWTWNKIERGKKGTLHNGILYLKGGPLIEEMAGVRKQYSIYELENIFDEDFFETKKIVYIRK